MIEKEDVVFTFNGILFSLKKGGNHVIYNNMDETGRHYKLSKPDTEEQILDDFTYMMNLKLIEVESRMVVTRGWWVGELGR